MISSTRPLTLGLLVVLSTPAFALFGAHSKSSSQYIHSNDTISLALDPTSVSQLSAPSGSEVNLDFVLINRGLQGHFTFSQSSEDNFRGVLSTRETYLTSGQQQTIKVRNMRVPERPDWSKVRFTLTVVKDSGTLGFRRRRDADPQTDYGSDDPRYGTNNNNGNYPNSNVNFPNNNNNNNNNNNYPPNSGLPNRPLRPGLGAGTQFLDPSFRSDLAITIEFTVTESMSDDRDPWTKLYYGAESDGETCMYEPGDPNCDNDYWWVKVRMSDEGEKQSGLNEITVRPEGQNLYGKPIYYRYANFPIGTILEQELIAAASCCLETMVVRVTDVAGNVGEVRATNGGTGAKLTTAETWGIVGGVLGFVLLVTLLIVLFCCCCRDGKCTGTCGGCSCCGYDAVSQS